MDKMQRDAALAELDRLSERGPIAKLVPLQIEKAAREIFEQRSLVMTGNKWDWSIASEEVQNRFRLEAFIEQWDRARKFSESEASEGGLGP